MKNSLLIQSCQSFFTNVPLRLRGSRAWLLILLLSGLGNVGWGQCFNTTTVPLANPITLPVGDSPGEVVMGDFNNDGKLDLATANFLSNNISVRLGDGNGNFGPTVNFAVGIGPSAIVMGDFNADARLDLATPNSDSRDVSVLLGNGSGGFGTALSVAVSGELTSAAVGDFNTDGKSDLAVVYGFGFGNAVAVLLSNGSGGFGAATDFPVGSIPSAVAVSDFNGDGKADLAVTNQAGGNVSVLLGDGSGGFGAATNFPVGSNPVAIAVGDFNADGRPDLTVANSSSDNVSVLLGNGSGGFGMAPNLTIENPPNAVAVGDFNSDGKLDLAIANRPNQGIGNVSVRLGNGDGSFISVGNSPSGENSPTFVATGDVNSDGKLDLTVANARSDNVSVLLGKGDGSFGQLVEAPRFVATGDFNGDGRPDVAVANADSDNITVLLNNGNGGFGTATNFPVEDDPTFIVVGDLNSDGRLDLVVAHFGSPNISVLLGDGSGNFGKAPDVAIRLRPSSLKLSDFNGDGKPDLAATFFGVVSILLGKGDGSFNSPTELVAGNDISDLAVGDLNGDNQLDLAITNVIDQGSSANVVVLLGNGNGGFSPITRYTVERFPLYVQIADLNGDNKADLAVTTNSSFVSVLLGNGDGSFGPVTNFEAGFPRSVEIVDINGDNKLDLALSNTTSNNVSVLLGNGSGGFGAATSFPVGLQPGSIAVGDFNGDGKVDLVTANSGSSNLSVLYNCNVPSNQAPTVANVIPPQSATVNQGFTLSLANTFTDAQTPNALVLSASGLPAGLSLAGTNITGTPSVSGVSTVTVTATAPDNFSVSTTFTLTVTPASTPPGPTFFAITGVTTVNCQVVSAGERLVSFTPQYSGLTGNPVSFSVANELSPTTAVGPYTLRLYTDNPVVTLKAQQAGTANEASFSYNWLAGCNGPAPDNTAPTVSNNIPNQTATEGQAFSYTIPANTFTDAQTPNTLVLSASGLPTELSLVGTTVTGTPSVSGVSTITITATDPGGLAVTTSFILTINPASTPVQPTTFAITGVTTVNCQVVTAGERLLSFTPQYAGLSGEPVSFSVANEMPATTAVGPYTLRLYTDNPTITLHAQQGSQQTSFSYDWLSVCGSAAARLGVGESRDGLRVQVLGNPVQNHEMRVRVNGVQGQPVRLQVLDERGVLVVERAVEQASAPEEQVLPLANQAPGVLLLQVNTARQRQTVKVINP